MIPADVGWKLLSTAAVVVGAFVAHYGAVAVTHLVTSHVRARFWVRQAMSLLALVAIIGGVLAIWVVPQRGSGLPVGLATAGLAVALQKVWTAFAGYLVLLRGRVYTVGDRIAIGDVRGDVLSVGFLYTRVMEMGQTPKEAGHTWVAARQFTGRIVTVTNDRVFNDAVFREDLTPRVYWRLTDNWLELTLRFSVRDHGVRDAKDRITRRLLRDLDTAGIEVASATLELVRPSDPARRID